MSNYFDLLFFFFLILLINRLYRGQQAKIGTSHGVTYNGHSAGMNTMSSKTSNYSPSGYPKAKAL